MPAVSGPSGVTSEIPAPDYDVAVFENRFPSLSGAGSAPFTGDVRQKGFLPGVDDRICS